jgi:hypothetical protein
MKAADSSSQYGRLLNFGRHRNTVSVNRGSYNNRLIRFPAQGTCTPELRFIGSCFASVRYTAVVQEGKVYSCKC